MPTKDGFDPAEPLPQFLVARAEQDMRGSENDPGGAAATSPVFKASALIAAVAATGLTVLAIGNPAALLAGMSAPHVGDSSSLPTPTAAAAPASIASTADAQAVPPTTNHAPARADIAASDPAGNGQAEEGESSEALFRQFQAWAAEQAAQAQRGPAQPVQDAPAQVVQPASAATNGPAPAAENVRVPSQRAQKRRQVRAAHNARAEMRTQNLQKQVRPAQGARAERPLMQDARAQDPSVQDAEAPTFLSIFGLRN